MAHASSKIAGETGEPKPKAAKRKSARPKTHQGPAKLLTEAQLEAANKALPKDERLKKTEGVVARGRTVYISATEKRTAGQTVQLPPAEIAKLRKLGHLVDPSRMAAPVGTGPRFFREDKASEGVEPPQG